MNQSEIVERLVNHLDEELALAHKGFKRESLQLIVAEWLIDNGIRFHFVDVNSSGKMSCGCA